MAKEGFNPKQFMINLRMLYLALVAGVIIFLAVVINLLGSENITTTGDLEILFLIDVIVTAVMLPGAYLISNRLYEQINRKESLANRLAQFQSAFIIRLAMIEAPALLSVIVLLLTGNISALALFALSLALFALNYPTPEKIGRTLDLSDKEKELLR